MLKIWFYHFQGYKTVYVNYLPLWNFLIFLLIPKKCLIGPITGTKYINQEANFFQKNIRKFIFPNFYISVKILKYQNRYVIFSNNNFLNLKKRLSLYIIFKFFILRQIKKKIKNIDIFVYLRSHSNKKFRKN